MLSVNVWTTRRWSLPEAVAGYVARGIGGIGLWREKVAEIGLDAAVKLAAGAFTPRSAILPWPFASVVHRAPERRA